MNKALLIYVVLAALTLAVFAMWPELDLAGARYFYHDGGFFGRDSLERFGRDFFRVTPFVVLTAYAALWFAKHRGARLCWAPSGRAVIFLIATMAIGPGLIVNLGLKSHWHRPRPVQTQDFNGPSPFKPWYEDDGGCQKNCSFVSGEAATGFWMVAPASVAPPPWRGPAIVAAFAFGFGASFLRLAFGGHYLSDVLLGGLITLILVEIIRRIIWPLGGSEPETLRRPGLRRSRGPDASSRPAE
jgi:membrane-associated phospholipid phosphatase